MRPPGTAWSNSWETLGKSLGHFGPVPFELIRDWLQCEADLAGAQGQKHLGYLFFSSVCFSSSLETEPVVLGELCRSSEPPELGSARRACHAFPLAVPILSPKSQLRLPASV